MNNDSFICRVLRHHSPEFLRYLHQDSKKPQYMHLHAFGNCLEQHAKDTWHEQMKAELLPQLVFHLLALEKPHDGHRSFMSLRTSFVTDDIQNWGLGPSNGSSEIREELHRAWYQPFRHDIIGDTLSADLLDYLHRDPVHLGIPGGLDPKLLRSFVLVKTSSHDSFNGPPEPTSDAAQQWYRGAVDLFDRKRGTIRSERLNDLFRLLDLRHQIHEKAVYHRVVQASIAMLSRAALPLHRGKTLLPTLDVLYGQTIEEYWSPAVAGEDRFLEILARKCTAEKNLSSSDILKKIVERRIYKPLLIVSGDRVKSLLGLTNYTPENACREIAAIIDSAYFASFFLLVSGLLESWLQHGYKDSTEVTDELNAIGVKLDEGQEPSSVPTRVIFWTLPYKQLFKNPAILIAGADNTVCRLTDLQDASVAPKAFNQVSARVQAGLADAEARYASLWKITSVRLEVEQNQLVAGVE